MKRKNYSASFKAKVGLEALKGEKTLSELSSIHGVHPNQIRQWKKKVEAGVVEIFQRQREKSQAEDEALKARLYQEIGQLKMELDWLKKKVF